MKIIRRLNNIEELNIIGKIFRKIQQSFCKHKWVHAVWEYKYYENRLICVKCGIFAEKHKGKIKIKGNEFWENHE